MTIKLGSSSRNAAADAVTALLNGGTVEIRTGTRPANPGTAAAGTLLATLTFPGGDVPAVPTVADVTR